MWVVISVYTGIAFFLFANICCVGVILSPNEQCIDKRSVRTFDYCLFVDEYTGQGEDETQNPRAADQHSGSAP